MGKKNKISSSILVVVPLALLQYVYWNWMIKSLTIDFDNISSENILYIISIIVTLIYCIYEKYFVFTIIYNDTTFRDRIPLAVLWILESVMGAIVSNRIVYCYEEKYERAFIIGFRSIECLFAGVILIVSFLFCRVFLYRKEEKRD